MCACMYVCMCVWTYMVNHTKTKIAVDNVVLVQIVHARHSVMNHPELSVGRKDGTGDIGLQIPRWPHEFIHKECTAYNSMWML